MKLKHIWLYLFFVVLCVTPFSGCNSISPYAKTEISGPAEKEKVAENININTEESAEAISGIPDAAPKPEVTDLSPGISSVGDEVAKSESAEPVEAVEPDDQELIDNAQEYCQTASDFLEQGDADNAIDSLDKAYSFILKVEETDNPELQQQKEDIRLTIAKSIKEVYSSRFTAVNGNGKAIPFDMNSYVQREIESFQGKERNYFLEAYARSGKYRPAMIKALKAAGFPEELSWLPLIESGFKARAQSTARALGMWQFMASTGYMYGLKRDTWIDERLDPAKSTVAAIGFFSDLHQMFGDWKTVLAAYNCGPRRVLNEINRQNNSLLDDFWDLYQRLPNETARFVPRFLAVLHIIHDPAAYGFELPELEAEDEYEEVTVNKQVTLATIAKAINVSDDVLNSLNPELRQNATPKTTYNLKIPVGKGEVLLANIGNIPSTALAAYEKSGSSSNAIHVVRSGDTLSSIAKKYRTSVEAIMSANGLKNDKTLKIGSRLKIPTHRKTVIAEANTLVSYSASGEEVTRYTVKYTIKKGDYPAIIAKRYNMDLYDFLKMNGLALASTIFPGQEVQVAME